MIPRTARRAHRLPCLVIIRPFITAQRKWCPFRTVVPNRAWTSRSSDIRWVGYLGTSQAVEASGTVSRVVSTTCLTTIMTITTKFTVFRVVQMGHIWICSYGTRFRLSGLFGAITSHWTWTSITCGTYFRSGCISSFSAVVASRTWPCFCCGIGISTVHSSTTLATGWGKENLQINIWNWKQKG